MDAHLKSLLPSLDLAGQAITIAFSGNPREAWRMLQSRAAHSYLPETGKKVAFACDLVAAFPGHPVTLALLALAVSELVLDEYSIHAWGPLIKIAGISLVIDGVSVDRLWADIERA